MRAPWNRSAVLTAAALAATAFSVGCKTDMDRANDAASTTIESSASDLSTGAADKAQASLGKLASESDLSPASKIGANIMLAKTDQALAEAKIGEVQAHQTQIASLLLGLDRLAWQVATNNANVSALTSLNPTAGQQAFTAQADAAEKGAGGAWVPGTPPIPSQADATQKADDLGKQIKVLADERTQLAAKRAVALESVTKLSQQADTSAGQQSVGYFIQSANQRKEARLNEIKMQDLDAQIMPLQQQLDVLKAQQEGATAAAASSRDQGQKLAAGWDAVQKQIEAVKDYSKYLVDGAGSLPASVTPAAGSSTATSQPAAAQSVVAIATELDQEVKAAADARSAALDLLDKAYKLYDDSAKQAETLVRALPKNTPDNQKLPERKAWEALAALHAPAEFKLGQAAVLSTTARIYAGQFIELQQRNAVVSQLTRALKQSGIDTPAPITALGEPGAVPAGIKDIQAELAKADFAAYDEKKGALDDLAGKETSLSGQEAIASTRADLYFSWSDSVNSDVINGAAAPGELGQLRTNLAHLSKMTNDYGWYQLAPAQGQNPAQRLSFAVTERRALEDTGKAVVPSVLPPELSSGAATQPGAPVVQPTDATSQPALDSSATSQPATTQPAAPGQ
jgi:hypothetical protein